MSKLLADQRNGYLKLVEDLRKRYEALSGEEYDVRSARKEEFRRKQGAALGLAKVEAEVARIDLQRQAAREKVQRVEREVDSRWRAHEAERERAATRGQMLFEQVRAALLGAEDAAEAAKAIERLTAAIAGLAR